MFQKSRSGGRAVLSAALLFALIAPASAFDFEPITQEFSTTGSGANHVFRVTNTTEERIAVRISVRSRTMRPDGSEELGPEVEEFVVFPRQLLLQPEERQSVRVRWSGPEEVEVERPYRIVAEQLPIDLGTDTPTQGGGIRLSYRYEGTIYVSSTAGEPDIRVTEVSRAGNGSILRIHVSNEGTRHTFLRDARLHLSDSPESGPAITLGPDQLPGLTGENVLAQSRRVFEVPMPSELWSGPIHADIDFVSD